jgi:hypothetical protein
MAKESFVNDKRTKVQFYDSELKAFRDGTKWELAKFYALEFYRMKLAIKYSWLPWR